MGTQVQSVHADQLVDKQKDGHSKLYTPGGILGLETGLRSLQKFDPYGFFQFVAHTAVSTHLLLG